MIRKILSKTRSRLTITCLVRTLGQVDGNKKKEEVDGGGLDDNGNS